MDRVEALTQLKNNLRLSRTWFKETILGETDQQRHTRQKTFKEAQYGALQSQGDAEGDTEVDEAEAEAGDAGQESDVSGAEVDEDSDFSEIFYKILDFVKH